MYDLHDYVTGYTYYSPQTPVRRQQRPYTTQQSGTAQFVYYSDVFVVQKCGQFLGEVRN